MATTTANLGLRKPATSDFITVTTDINDNMDKLDLWFPSSTDNGFAEYSKDSNQTITTGTDTKVSFGNGLVTTPLLSANGSFDIFTVNRAGVWGFGWGIGRWSANPTENFVWLGPAGGVATRFAVTSIADTVQTAKGGFYREVELALSDQVAVWVWQNSGSNKDITDEWLRATYFTAKWLRPTL